MKYWSVGVLEYCPAVNKLYLFCLHYSITPVLQLSMASLASKFPQFDLGSLELLVMDVCYKSMGCFWGDADGPGIEERIVAE